MKKKKTVKIIIIVAAIVVVVAAALILVRVLNKNKKVEVISVAMINDSWLASEQGTYTGTVSTGRIQNVKLKKALVEEVRVHVGDQVNVGDTLLVYNAAEYQIALLNDKAHIATLEAQIDKAQRAVAKYASLRPSEEAPKPWEETIDHGPLPIKDVLTEEDLKEDKSDFLITLETKIEKSFLKALREKKYSTIFLVYEGDACFATYYLDGADIPKLADEFVPVGEEPASEEESTDEPTTKELSAKEPSTKEPSSEEPTTKEPETEDPREYKRIKTDPIKKDWQLKNILEYTENGGRAKINNDVKYYGKAAIYTPVVYERYETVIHYPQVDPESEDYIFSRAELAQMIQANIKEAQELKRDLLIAQITLQKDQLTADTGEVKATVSGVVTEVGDVTHAAVGDKVITVKGNENYSVVVYVDELSLSKFNVGDEGTITAYESGSFATGKVTEIENTPGSVMYGYGNVNPNSSFYPVTMVVEESDVDMIIGEYCQVQMNATQEVGTSIYIPLMYVRNDEKGHYCMVAENNRLKKRYVVTGANFWGSEIEIKQGLSEEDYVAFPYGAGENQGAPVEISDSMY